MRSIFYSGNWRQKGSWTSWFASARKDSRYSSQANSPALDWCIDDNFIKVRTVRYLRDLSHHQILNVYNRDLIANPRGTFQMLCDFVSVSCYTAFVELAKNDLYSKLSRTRYMIEWSNERKEKVTREIQKFYCLKSHFSFESD